MPKKRKKHYFYIEYQLIVTLIIVGVGIFVAGMKVNTLAYLDTVIIHIGIAGVVILMWLVFRWWMWRMDGPIERIEKALDRLQKSSKWKGVHIRESKEISDLSEHFNKALKNIRDQFYLKQKVLDEKTQKLVSTQKNLDQEKTTIKSERETFKRRIQELSILRELSERIGYSLDMQNIVDVITGSLGKLLDYSSISYMLWDDDTIVFRCNIEQSVPETYVLNIKRKMLESFRALRGQDISEEQVQTIISGAVLDESVKAEVLSFFNGPLVIKGETVGILNVASTKKQNYSEPEMTLLYTITKQVSNAVAKLQNLLESEKGRLNAMVASLVDGVIMTDPDLKLTVINPAFLSMMGFNETDQPNVFDVVEALREKVNFKEKLEESLKLDRVVSTEEFLINNRFLQLFIAPVKDREHKSLGVVAVFHDVTQSKELERLREDFTSMMVHELRSPLDGIRKITEVLQKPETQANPKSLSEFTNMIHRSSSEMLELVGDLLDIAKIEAGKFDIKKEESNLLDVVEDRKKYFSGLAEEAKLTIEVQTQAEDLQKIAFDEARIKQVLNNALSNAIKFTEPGGRIYIQIFRHTSTKSIHDEAHKQNIDWKFDESRKENGKDWKDSIILAVTDTGRGISKDHVEDAFNKFKQFEASKKSEKRGTGLGLAIVKGIIEAHGGHVAIGSVEGKGTTIVVALPI